MPPIKCVCRDPFEAEGPTDDLSVECNYLDANGHRNLMAKLRRSSKAGNPLNKTGFYSFVEDWDRCEKACGYKKLRRARFVLQSLNGEAVKDANFTKVESGCDAFAKDWAKAIPCSQGFVLETGVDIVKNNTILHALE